MRPILYLKQAEYAAKHVDEWIFLTNRDGHWNAENLARRIRNHRLLAFKEGYWDAKVDGMEVWIMLRSRPKLIGACPFCHCCYVNSMCRCPNNPNGTLSAEYVFDCPPAP